MSEFAYRQKAGEILPLVINQNSCTVLAFQIIIVWIITLNSTITGTEILFQLLGSSHQLMTPFIFEDYIPYLTYKAPAL